MKQRLEDCDRYSEECGSPDLDDEPPAGASGWDRFSRRGVDECQDGDAGIK